MPAKFWILGSLACIVVLHLLSGAPLVDAHGGIEPGRNPLTVWNANPLPSLGMLLLDPRTVLPEQDKTLVGALRAALSIE